MEWRFLSIEDNLTADWNVVDQLQLLIGTILQHLVEAAIVNAPTNIEELLRNLVVHVLQLGVHIEARMLFHKLRHIFFLLILNVIPGKLLQATSGDT